MVAWLFGGPLISIQQVDRVFFVHTSHAPAAYALGSLLVATPPFDSRLALAGPVPRLAVLVRHQLRHALELEAGVHLVRGIVCVVAGGAVSDTYTATHRHTATNSHSQPHSHSQPLTQPHAATHTHTHGINTHRSLNRSLPRHGRHAWTASSTSSARGPTPSRPPPRPPAAGTWPGYAR